MSVQVQTKTVVSVAEMARMVGLSRARFYQLVNDGVFPSPLYRIETRRPFFNQDMQETCLAVRRGNCGLNGKPVLFYASTIGIAGSRNRRRHRQRIRTSTPTSSRACELGLTTVRCSDVEAAIQQNFPNGKSGIDDETVLRTVFLFLKPGFGRKCGDVTSGLQPSLWVELSNCCPIRGVSREDRGVNAFEGIPVGKAEACPPGRVPCWT